jgi:hypothetical protein
LIFTHAFNITPRSTEKATPDSNAGLSTPDKIIRVAERSLWRESILSKIRVRYADYPTPVLELQKRGGATMTLATVTNGEAL